MSRLEAIVADLESLPPSFTLARSVRSGGVEQLAYIEDLLRYTTVIIADRRTTEGYGQVKVEVARVGRPIPDNDLWIAAVARRRDLPLATRDAHFSAVPGLKIAVLSFTPRYPCTSLSPAA